jgi:ubiquitin-conjugating enzyme E2 variant
VLEIVSAVAFAVLVAIVAVQAAKALGHRDGLDDIVLALGAAVAALALADLMSGIVHFLFDTFGTPDTPIIGQKFVKPFRDHHDHPGAMTRDDAIAVNADNLFACLPVLALAVGVGHLERHAALAVFVLVLVTAVAFTNQFHKWAHMPVVPRPVAFAQRHGLILTVGHHDQHHAAPHDRHHCITFGRMDRVLDLVTVPWSARRRATHPTAR